jgi:hypothetical protein
MRAFKEKVTCSDPILPLHGVVTEDALKSHRTGRSPALTSLLYLKHSKTLITAAKVYHRCLQGSDASQPSAQFQDVLPRDSASVRLMACQCHVHASDKPYIRLQLPSLSLEYGLPTCMGVSYVFPRIMLIRSGTNASTGATPRL